MIKQRKNSMLKKIRTMFLRAVIAVIGVWVVSIVLFAFLPVPFSAVMVERQISAWLEGDIQYVAGSEWVNRDQIAAWMPLAVVAAEDQTFPTHWGFDMKAIQSVIDSKSDHMRGASTLSQQTVKNLFLWDGRSWLRKGLEAVLTVGIETLWPKKRIITVYLNIAEFGKGVFGVEEAAQHYFHKPASKLSMSEAALLAAVLPNPVAFRVEAPSAYVRQRQQWILRQMQQLGGQVFVQKNRL